MDDEMYIGNLASEFRQWGLLCILFG